MSKHKTPIRSDIQRLFEALDRDGDQQVTRDQILDPLTDAGIRPDDHRIRPMLEAIGLANLDAFDAKAFSEVVRPSFSVFRQVVIGDLVIPDFRPFSEGVDGIFDRVRRHRDGDVADYIPQLAKIDPNRFAAAICTLDGQQYGAGDIEAHFGLQSTCKPILYCIALELLGEEKVHRHIGREPSGHSFNELSVNPKGLPHNPMINAGAIMSTALILPEANQADRFDRVMDVIAALSGGVRPIFNNAVYNSERDTADRNHALAYLMREKGAFPEGTDITRTLELYFQFCSIEVTARSLAVLSATFANGGICPLTGERVFSTSTVKNCLSLMASCGMYDFSGEFAFSVGVPAKSGVSGAIWGVVPNLMGVAVWSPPLDRLGNSVRGLAFFQELVKAYGIHAYDTAIGSSKCDPRRREDASALSGVLEAIDAASHGDVDKLCQLFARGVDLSGADYDGRTPMHLAAAEGHCDVIRYLLARGVPRDPLDRWGNKPVDDAARFDHDDATALLKPLKRTRKAA